MSVLTAPTRLTTTLLQMSPSIGHWYVTTSTPSRVGCGSIVLIFNARVHIGHKETSITVSTLPSAARVSGSLDAPMTEVKLPKTSQ